MNVIFRATIRTVLRPVSLTRDKAAIRFTFEWGWIFILIRWGYYTLLFAFREYNESWMPIIGPPFGLDKVTYGQFQTLLALPFGILLMLLLATLLRLYFRMLGKSFRLWHILNILGIAFFLPFVLVQPIDFLILQTVGWKPVPVAIIHIFVLIWECTIATLIFSTLVNLNTREKLGVILILMITWILVTGMLWR